MMCRRQQHRHRGAFSLVEVLISIAITTVIVVLLFQVFVAAATQWQASDQRIDTFRDARAALHFIARDLSRAHVNASAGMLRLSDTFGDFAKEAYAVTASANSGKSDLCAVGYYCAWDGATKTFTLKRLFRDSDAAFGLLKGATMPNFNALFAKDAALEEAVAAYVWDLQFRPGVEDTAVNPSSAQPPDWRWVEIRFKSMSPASARRLRDLPVDVSTWFDAASDVYRTHILPFEQQFVTRVSLHQRQ
ncbi:MAG TPA: prepilin-type N-terminal cleavage/methylation domain-containing protein [Chthoniobacterales bacterium]|nr:prepilin-type N-terminal cleavage/methylation domain-containing protein [Chthoniobacterales bacterium]